LIIFLKKFSILLVYNLLKDSASKLISINRKLSDKKKKRIHKIGFGGMLNLKCPNVPEMLSQWLVSIFDTISSQLVLSFKGRIEVNGGDVHRFFLGF
jgi:hypothetical protein